MKQEFEACGSAAVPFKWESAPGKPIEEAVVILPASSDPWTSPLRPPPGLRKPVKSTKSTVEVSVPAPPVLAETKLAQKIFKKFHGLRRKSGASTACTLSDASRYVADRGKLLDNEDVDSCYDSSASMSNFSVSTFGQQETSFSFTSFESSSSSDPYSIRLNRDAGTCSAQNKTRAQPSSFLFEDVGGSFANDLNACDDHHTLPGPRESAWHEFSGELDRHYVPSSMQIRRSHSILIPTILRHYSSLRNLAHFSFGRTFRRSKATKQPDPQKT